MAHTRKGATLTGSPFSNVLPQDPGESTFQDVLTTQVGDTTEFDETRPEDSPGESSIGVETDGFGNTHESGQDETAGQTDESGTNVTEP